MATLVKNGYLGALGGGSGVSLMRRLNNLTRSILSAFSGSLYLPSPTSCFTDVAGTTPCTVDSSVALMLDEMRTLGSELVTNGDFSAGTTGWTLTQPTSGSVGVVAGEMRLNSVDGSAAVFSPTVVTTTIGRTYITTFDARVISGVVNFRDAGGGVIRAVSNGANSFIYQATTANCQFARVGICDVYFDNISVREVTGIHATQATAGFRPVLRGKVKNLLTNSVWAGGTSGTEGAGAVAPTGWTFPANTGVITYSGVTARFQATAQRPYLGFNIISVVGLSYTVQAVIDINASAAQIQEVLQLVGAGGTVGAAAYSINGVSVPSTAVPVGGDIIRSYATCTGAGTLQARVGLGTNGSATGDVTMSKAQLELGTVANPYVATGATVASSSYGPYWLDFDGVDDRMQLSAVPFQMADDSFVVAGATPNINADMHVFSISNTTNAVPYFGRLARITGNCHTYFRDNAATLASMAGNAWGIGVPRVTAITKSGSAKKLLSDGIQQGATNNTAMGATTVDVATIGAFVTTPAASSFFNGPIYSIALGKGAISDAQLLTIERYVGQKTGVTI